VKPDKVLDIRGWSSPWSILKTKNELKLMEPGQTLEVLVSDLGDFPAVLSRSNHRLLATDEQVGFSRLYVRRGPDKSHSINHFPHKAQETLNHKGERDDNRES
jgi:TusA-related sulfurtransferase